MNLQKVIFIGTDTEHTLLFKNVCESLDLADYCMFLPAIPVTDKFFREVEQYCSVNTFSTIVILDIDTASFAVAAKFINAFKSGKTIKRVPLIAIYSPCNQRDINEILLSGVNSFFIRPDTVPAIKKLLEDIVRYWALEFVM